MNNAIKVISPYKYNEMWVFDDETTGLVREPFVSGARQGYRRDGKLARRSCQRV